VNETRWQQVSQLYHAVLERGEHERDSFLLAACGQDEELRREVESLLEQENSQTHILDRAAMDLLNNSALTRVTAGTLLGPYRVEGPLGAGGMGEVFRAVDTRLGRNVAIKVCGKQFSGRFEREARAISTLNHPHVCTLYDVGPNYLVMELVDGETLADRLEKRPLPMDQVLRYGAQIADALAAAHAKQIVHRDLKPGNIMITKAGVKVLDFGLAKTQDTETLTRSNMVMGTPAYMAPEQRAGKESDARTDIYALGLVLREMATGKREGNLDGLDPVFTHVVERCLETDPADRWQAASDIRKELEWAATIPASTPGAARKPSRIGWIIGAVAGAGLLVAVTVALMSRESPIDLGPSEFTISFDQTDGSVPVPSPDGRSFVFFRNVPGESTSLWLRRLESVEAQRLPGTEGAEGEVIWSPDGAWIAFYSGGKLRKVGRSGGAPQTIADLPGFQAAAWSPHGDIIYRPTNRIALFRIPDTGGTPQPLTTLNASLTENSHRFPQFLPDGRQFLFVSRCADRVNNALYIGSLDSPMVRRIMPAESRVTYIPAKTGMPASLLFYRDGALLAQRFDLDTVSLTGEPMIVLNGVDYNPPSIQAFFQASADGRVVVARSVGSSETRLVWYNRNGDETGTLGPPGEYAQPRISPDGTRVLFQRPDPQTGNRDLWYMEIVRRITSRLTNNVANDWTAVWSPGGDKIVFGSDRDGGTVMRPYLKTSMDLGSGESPLPISNGEEPYDWSSDGLWISYGADDLRVASASGSAPQFVFLGTPAWEVNGRFSPDTRWIAYSSNESGRFEVYVRPFAGELAAATGKIQISNNGGEYPVWSPSGKEIFYMAGDATIFAVDSTNLGRRETLPAPKALFKACPGTLASSMPFTGNPYSYSFDTRDGQRFLVNCVAQPPGKFTVRMNWKFPD
jgi:eukaryotic-like serine/threonine-protein kinase